jgi:hypothetical protein
MIDRRITTRTAPVTGRHPAAGDDVGGQADDVRAAAVVRAAVLAGYVYPEDAPKLVDLDRVVLTDDGRVMGARGVVEDLAERRPELFDRRPSGGTPPPKPFSTGLPVGPAWSDATIRREMARTGRYSRM